MFTFYLNFYQILYFSLKRQTPKLIFHKTRVSEIVIGNFNIPFSAKGRTNGQKMSKDKEDLNSTTNQQDLSDIRRT